MITKSKTPKSRRKLSRVEAEKKASQGNAPRVFWHSYHAPTSEVRAVSDYKGGLVDYSRSLHNLRDGGAWTYLLPLFIDAGWRFGGIVLNLPWTDFACEQVTDGPVQIQAKDILVFVTRPPLSDTPWGFSKEEIDLPAVSERLRQPGCSLSKLLSERLSDKVKGALGGCSQIANESQTEEDLMDDLNRILEGRCLSPNPPADVELSTKTFRLLKTKPEGTELIQLNRMLIEAAFPGAITPRHRARRIVGRSNTELETDAFRTLRRCFLRHCSRTRIRLASQLGQTVGPDWEEIRFMENNTAIYDRTWAKNHRKLGEEKTAGYLLYSPNLVTETCADSRGQTGSKSGKLLCLWGAGGTESLWLSYAFAVNERLRDLLLRIVRSKSLHFVLLEWPADLHVPPRPGSLEFLEKAALKLTPVLHAKAEFAPDESQLTWTLVDTVEPPPEVLAQSFGGSDPLAE